MIAKNKILEKVFFTPTPYQRLLSLLRYASTYRSRFLILKIRKKSWQKCIRRSIFQKRKWCDLGLEDVTKPFKTQDMLDTIHRFDDSKKKNHVRIFFCEFLSQVNDVRSWHEQSSEGQCILGWWLMCRVRSFHEGHKVC